MNQLMMQHRRNGIANLIRPMNRHKNVLKWSEGDEYGRGGESDAHINMKFQICRWLKKQNIEFYSESILNSGLRCDIIDADRSYIIEVVNTESEESIIKKRKDYPLPIIVVNANQEFNEKLVT